jgi:TolC family type I secretion outer membrane protein
MKPNLQKSDRLKFMAIDWLHNTGQALFVMIGVAVFVVGVGAIEVKAQSLTQPKALAIEEKLSTAGAALSLSDALQHVYETNPKLLRARAELKAVEEKIPQAYANFKPTIAARAGITTSDQDGTGFGMGGAAGNASGTTSKELGLSLNQPLFRGGRSMVQLEAARYTLASQQALFKQIEQGVFLEAVSAYMDVLRDQAALGLAQNNLDVMTRRLRETEARYEAGELTMTDVAQARARKAAGEANFMATQASYRASMALFVRTIGYRPDNLVRPMDISDLPRSLDEALALAEKSNPAIIAADNAQRAAEEDADMIFGELLPEVGLIAELTKIYNPQPGGMPDQSIKTIGVQANIPLYTGGATRSRLRESKYIAQSRLQEARDTRDSVQQDTITSWEMLQAARSEVIAREAQIEAAELARRGVIAEEGVGTRTVLDILDAEQDYLQAQLDMVIAQRNDLVEQFRLMTLIGTLELDFIGFSEKRELPQSFQSLVTGRILNMDVDSLSFDE